MTDVARLAGVSHQTVSRVLNGHPNVREQTRNRVRAAISELGYRPNRAAKALVTGRSQGPGRGGLPAEAGGESPGHGPFAGARRGGAELDAVRARLAAGGVRARRRGGRV